MTVPAPRRADDAMPPERACQLTSYVFARAATGDYYRAASRIADVLDEVRAEAYERGLAAGTRAGAA